MLKCTLTLDIELVEREQEIRQGRAGAACTSRTSMSTTPWCARHNRALPLPPSCTHAHVQSTEEVSFCFLSAASSSTTYVIQLRTVDSSDMYVPQWSTSDVMMGIVGALAFKPFSPFTPMTCAGAARRCWLYILLMPTVGRGSRPEQVLDGRRAPVSAQRDGGVIHA
jgi:hypothetical protein